MITRYTNTETTRTALGTDRLPEYCEGPKTAAFIFHDDTLGVFLFANDGEEVQYGVTEFSIA